MLYTTVFAEFNLILFSFYFIQLTGRTILQITQGAILCTVNEHVACSEERERVSVNYQS